MSIIASEILDSVGIIPDPSYYSGRSPRRNDISGEKLYKIYEILYREDTEQAKKFVTLVKNIKYLSASNFIKAFFKFADASFNYNPNEATVLATFSSSICSGPDETDLIKRDFLSLL